MDIGEVIVIIMIILYIGFVICFNSSLYKGIKESWKSKDWALAAYGLFLFLVEILFFLSIVCYYSQID